MVAAIGLFALKTGPLYLENGSISKAMDDLIHVPNIGKQGKKAIRKRLDGQFYVDAVESIEGKDIQITKSKEKKVWLVTADYEAKRVLAKNVYVLVHFSKTVEVPR